MNVRQLHINRFVPMVEPKLFENKLNMGSFINGWIEDMIFAKYLY